MKSAWTRRLLTFVAAGAALVAHAAPQEKLDRTVVPVQLPKPQVFTQLDARDVKTKPSHLEVKAPGGAPNVIIILIDDLGFPCHSAAWKWCERSS